MFGDIFSDWKIVVYSLVAIFYFQLIKYLDKQFAQKRPFSDEEYLFKMAKIMECSEYDIFFQSAKEWRISKEKTEDDFKEYLLNETLPYYVKDFIRKTRK